jgi:hypothetical protein
MPDGADGADGVDGDSLGDETAPDGVSCSEEEGGTGGVDDGRGAKNGSQDARK